MLGHGYRPPALLAKMAATLQVFSENRFMLGIGAGWRGDEYHAYGYEFPSPSVRYAQLEEVVAICRLMWTEDDPSFVRWKREREQDDERAVTRMTRGGAK